MSDVRFLGDTATDTLAGLVFELASQLHEERARRLALEETLKQQGIDLTRVDALVEDPAFRDASRSAADASIRRLLTILEENGPPEGPLRAEAPVA